MSKKFNIFEVGSSALFSSASITNKSVVLTSTQRKDKLGKYYYDVNNSYSEDKLVGTIFDRFIKGELDCLVFTIGFYHKYTPIEDLEIDVIIDGLKVGTLPIIRVIHRLVKLTNGMDKLLPIFIINSVTSKLKPSEYYYGHLGYTISKAALHDFCKNLNRELEVTKSNISINEVFLPAVITKPFMKHGLDHQEYLDKLINKMIRRVRYLRTGK
jgi:NAD(P)-dependent dehydrogenase (short-subunit alcohol dehydrogenase family)